LETGFRLGITLGCNLFWVLKQIHLSSPHLQILAIAHKVLHFRMPKRLGLY